MRTKFQNLNRQPTNYVTMNAVPRKFSNYLLDLNYIYSNSEASSELILGREKEISRIYSCFLKSKKNNAILLGERGVGKTAIVQKIVYNVINNRCPKGLRNHHFLYLDVELLLASMSNDKKSKKLLEKIIDFINSYKNIVLVIDQVHLVQADCLISYYFSLLVRQPFVKIIGISTENDFYSFFEFDKKTRARLNIIPILEPKPKKIYPMIHKVVENLEKFHGVTINKDLIRYIISVSAAFYNETCNPELTLDIIEKSMVATKRKRKKEVTKEFINSNFNFDYELYSEMSAEDIKIVAYHEAGHFLVAKLSDNIRNFKTTAITIIPAEDFLGLTMFEFEPEHQTSLDMQYYIDNIAVDLAGRIAEKICFDSDRYTSGASQDLINATRTARNIVTQYGMLPECGENMAYLGVEDLTSLSLMSESIKNSIDKATKKLISQAEKRANSILSENKLLLEKIASELIANEVLDEKDLDRICESINNK